MTDLEILINEKIESYKKKVVKDKNDKLGNIVT